jgi:hypothetical protein
VKNALSAASIAFTVEADKGAPVRALVDDARWAWKARACSK